MTAAPRPGRPSDPEALVAEGRRVLALEAKAISELEPRLGADFARACTLVADAGGRVVTCGIGKSGHIARKLAGTLTSTGTPAIFLHPVEALHGDLGIVGRDDVGIVVSKSGDSEELRGLINHLSRMGVPIIALVGSAESELADHAEVVLDCSVGEEACPMDLAPTSSSTAALAMADALAITVFQLKGFRPEDFAALHPGGALGRKLSVYVRDVMVVDDFPSLGEDASVRDVIAPLAERRGTVPIIDAEHRLVGVVTAGDLTRLMEHDRDFLDRGVRDIMTHDPKTASANELGSAAASRMEAHGVMALPVVREDRTVEGVVHLHDLMRAGAV